MKKQVFLGIGALAIALVVSFNLNLAKSNSDSLIFMNITALASETGGGDGESGDLSKGCKTETDDCYSTEHNTKTVTKKCVSGSSKSCQYGKEVSIDGVNQAGSSMTTYTCR